MGTKAQLITFKDEDNKVKRIGIREKIYTHLKDFAPYRFSVREIALNLSLEYRQVQPRISELLNAGLIMIEGEKEEGAQTNSMFKINPNPNLFGYGSKSKLEIYREAVKKSLNQEEVEAIEDEFKRLVSLNS